MRLLHWLEVRDFKRFGESQRIKLDHPSVLIGPNNSGKTTALQAIALWSQAVKTWYESKGKAPPAQRTSTSLNRLHIVAVPVRRTRLFWHNATVRTERTPKAFHISLGLLHEGAVQAVTMTFTYTQDELVYCTPDEATIGNGKLIQAAANLNVGLLYPMSGLETEEPVLQPGRIDVLLGQGQTAQVLRNLCLMVYRQSPDDWHSIVQWISRLFEVELQAPEEDVARGSVGLVYRQTGSRTPFDLELAGRGMQQMLLILAYLFAHRRSVLLIDEPDAHLEILRQKQVYALLTEIADQAESQVILATHSEVVLDEAFDTNDTDAHNLTFLLGGASVELPTDSSVRKALAYFGADHYVRARQTGYVLYVEGRTDIEILKALARKLKHPVYDLLDGRINSYYVQSNYPEQSLEARLEGAEGGYGLPAKEHYFTLRSMLPQLKGLAIFDSDGQSRTDWEGEGFSIAYWSCYEIENYTNPSRLDYFIFVGQVLEGLPDPRPAAQPLDPLRGCLPGVQDRLQRVLLGLQVRIDAALDGSPQLPEEALHRVQLGGIGRLHHLGRVHGLHVRTRVAAGPVPDPAVDVRFLRPGPPDAGHLLALHVRLPRPPQLPCQGIDGDRHIEVLPAHLHGLGHGHPARGPHLAHLAAQPQLHLVAPHDPLAQPQAHRLQLLPEPPFFQVSWAWGSAWVWRGRGRLSRIPSRGSSVYRLPTA